MDGEVKERARLSALRIGEEARGRTTPRLILWLVAGALMVVAISAAALVLRARAVEVEVATTQAGATGQGAALLNASGYVTPRRRATVAAKITGRVEQVFTDEGMIVREGDVLATLDASEAVKQLAAARAQRDATAAAIVDLQVQLANAERELERQLDLQRQDVASVQVLDLARTSADSLKAKIALAREQVKAADASIAMVEQAVEDCTVRAPFAGVVVSKDAQRGEMVSPVSAGGGFTRTGIATIVDMASLEIEVDVNESYIARVRTGQLVEATLDAYPDWHIPAKVRTVIPTADRQRATIKVRITFDRLEPRILPDMGVKVAFLRDEQPGEQAGAPAAFAPQSAIRADGGGQNVVFIVTNGALERRAVKTGRRQGDLIEIVAGLAGGETVVVSGPGDLREGQRARVKK